jgi:outer membrane autotransporter protein
MTAPFKKALLAGTALVAVAAFAPSAQAAVVAQTLTGATTWAIDGNQNQSPADGSGAAASDTVNVVTFTLTVANAGVANDGGGINSFTLGAVTGTTGSLTITTGALGGANPDIAATVASVALTGAGNVTVASIDADNAAVTATFTGALSTGGALAITNTETSTADDVSATVGGALSVGGTTGLTAGAFAGATSNLTVTGNSTFTGAVTLTGGAGAGSTANLNLNGATNAFTGGLTLATAAKSILTLGGSSAQTVSGNITGAGSVVVDNASGATFSGTIGAGAGAITIEKASGNSAATFQNTLNVSSVTLGGAGTGTNTATFDVATNDFTVTGTVDGAIAGETNNVVVSGGSGTLTQATAWGGVTGTIDNLTVSGSGTILDSNAAITAAATTIGSGATLDVGAGLLTSAVANSGTLLLSGTGGVTGNITGTGTLDVNENASVTGGITQGSTTIAEGKTLTVVGGAARAVTTDILLEDATSNGTDAGLTFDNGAFTTTVTGDITTGVTGEGLITFANDTGATLALVGDVGTSSVKVGNITITDAAGAQTLTTTGDLYVNAISLGQDDTLQFLGTSAQTVSGTIAGAGAGKGILTVGNGTAASDVTFDGIIGGTTLASATVAASSTAHFNANVTLAGALTNNGTTEIAVGKTLTAVGFSGTGAYTIDIEDANASGTLTSADFGSLNGGGGAINLAAETVNFNFTGNTATGSAVVLGTGGAASTTAATVTDNSFLYNAALAANGNNLELTVTRAALETSSATTNGQNVGAVLDALTTTTDTELGQIQDEIAQASTQAELDEVLEAAGPTVDLGVVNASLNVVTQTLGLTDTRLASLRTGDESTGMAAGNVGRGLRLWGQAFGLTGDQDLRDGVDGYDVDTIGAAIGLDTANLHDNAVVGVAFSYGDTEVDSDNANDTQTDIGSYQVTLYGDVDINERTFFAGQAAYAFNDIESTRYDVGGVSGLTADADYDSNQFTVAGKLGHDYATDQGLTLTPALLADYTHLSIDDYTETGAGGANLDVDSDSLNALNLGVGLDASWLHQNADGSYLKPALHAAYRYDLIGDNLQTTSTFTGGGAAFETQGMDPARSTFNVGAGLNYMATNNWEFSANYDYEFKSDYGAHSGTVRAAYKF